MAIVSALMLLLAGICGSVLAASQPDAPDPASVSGTTTLAVGSVTYEIPLSYGVTPSGILRVSFPDFRPLKGGSGICSLSLSVTRKTPCVEFNIAPGAFSGTNALNAERSLFREAVPLDGPAGYKYHTFGPEDARVHDYFKSDKNGSVIEATCFIESDPQSSICETIFPTLDGVNHLHLIFSLDEIDYLEDIEHGAQNLVRGFVPDEKVTQ